MTELSKILSKLTPSIDVGGAYTRIPHTIIVTGDTPAGPARLQVNTNASYPSVVVRSNVTYPILDIGRYAIAGGASGEYGLSQNHSLMGASAFAEVAQKANFNQHELFARAGISRLWVNSSFGDQSDTTPLFSFGMRSKLTTDIELYGEFSLKGQRQASGSLGMTWQFGRKATPPDTLAERAKMTLQAAQESIVSVRRFSEKFVSDFEIIKDGSLETDNFVYALADYVNWVTDPNSKWNLGEPKRNSYSETKAEIHRAAKYALSAIPYSESWKKDELHKLEADLKQLDMDVLQPILNVIYFNNNSALDYLKKQAEKIDDALYTKKDSAQATDLIEQYKAVLNAAFSFYNQIRPLIQGDQRLKTQGLEPRLSCLVRGDMCSDAATHKHSLPSLQMALEKLIKGEGAPKTVGGQNE